MWWNDTWPMPWMFFGPIAMIAFAFICIAMMLLMMRGGPTHRHRRQDAVEILKERFARGEINQAEYEERRRMLEN